ncbi:MAG: pseudouridine synthase, partial [Candidatus Latescibacterota bacterium]|nr:pseudouridine synthase [Candidatus Latescibacterota bacterium]
AFSLDWPNRPKRVYDPQNGKLGITEWEVIERTEKATRVRFKPITGRTHQLRVHAAHEKGIGHPIIGDSLYGNPDLAERLMLHSTQLSFNHPETSQRLHFDMPAPF